MIESMISYPHLKCIEILAPSPTNPQPLQSCLLLHDHEAIIPLSFILFSAWRHKCAIKNCASYMMTSNLHGNIVYHEIGPWLLLQACWYNLLCWFSSYRAGDRSFIYKGRCQSFAIPMALSAAAPGKGGVLDRPVEKTTPGRQSEFDVK